VARPILCSSGRDDEFRKSLLMEMFDADYELVPAVKASASEAPPTVYERKVQRLRRRYSGSEQLLKSLHQRAIYAVAAIPASPNARARGPTTPVVEGKPLLMKKLITRRMKWKKWINLP
jgi:hypothetical protein